MVDLVHSGHCHGPELGDWVLWSVVWRVWARGQGGCRGKPSRARLELHIPSHAIKRKELERKLGLAWEAAKWDQAEFWVPLDDQKKERRKGGWLEEV